MRRRDREVIEIGECASLAVVIDRLQAICRRLPSDSEPQVTIGGNEHFGWSLTISFSREPTTEEMALEAKYSMPRQEPELSPRTFSWSDWAPARIRRRAAERPPSELRP